MLGETNESWTGKRREAAREAILAAAWEAAREHGLAALTLRDVAARVGMQAPSLYSHFGSKHAIYDAMFAEAWCAYEEVIGGLDVPVAPRAALRLITRTYFDFSVADLARHQIMDVNTIPAFTPTPESYAPAVRVFDRLVAHLEAIGLHPANGDIDVFTAITGGLIVQQWANDPGGTRWARLVDRVIDMFADALDLPEDEPEEPR